MKKTKITECYDGEYPYVVIGNRILGAEVTNKMIDALIVAKGVIEDADVGYYPDEYEKVIEALKKAGVEL